MPPEQVTIQTRDGKCPAHVMMPAGEGRWPATIFYMDAGGIRPAVLEMAQRLADAGYVVLLPDLFYRFGPYETLVPKEVFKGDVRANLGPLMATTGNNKAAEDTEVFLAYLDTRGDVAGSKVGAVGFCMGGGMAIAAAGTYPDHFAVDIEDTTGLWRGPPHQACTAGHCQADRQRKEGFCATSPRVNHHQSAFRQDRAEERFLLRNLHGDQLVDSEWLEHSSKLFMGNGGHT